MSKERKFIFSKSEGGEILSRCLHTLKHSALDGKMSDSASLVEAIFIVEPYSGLLNDLQTVIFMYNKENLVRGILCSNQ